MLAPIHSPANEVSEAQEEVLSFPGSPTDPSVERHQASGHRAVHYLRAGLEATSCGLSPSAVGVTAAPSPTPAVAGSPKGNSFRDYPQHFAGGQPPITPAAPKLRALCFDSFAILHSGNTKTPIYVAERLNRQILLAGKGLQRTDKFYAEARLPRGERAELGDYRGSGWSRGHMAPAGDMGTPEAMAQSFSLANMVPQDAKQNGGPWAKIEDDTRKYVMRARGDVYVITGPVFEPAASTIGTGRVAVPSHLFKLVYDPATGKSWAHWQANAPGATLGRPISYDEVVRRTGDPSASSTVALVQVSRKRRAVTCSNNYEDVL